MAFTTTNTSTLRAIEEKMLTLAEMVSHAITDSVSALINVDTALARRIGENDTVMNDVRLQIEESCYQIVSTDQVAETRLALSAVAVTSSLERVGDHAARIAHLALRSARTKNRAEVPVEIPTMAEIGRELIDSSVDAFVSRNSLVAEATVRRDRELHDLYEQCYLNLALRIAAATEPEPVMSMMWVAHNLDRIGDQAANICERAIYVTTGEMKEFH